MNKSLLDVFRLDNRITIITGGAGFMGAQHANAIAEAGGIPILWDIDRDAADAKALEINHELNVPCLAMEVDITQPMKVRQALREIVKVHGKVDILINNAANDPKVTENSKSGWSRFENFSIEMWQKDMAVGLTGAFVCSQVVGSFMAEHGRGAILNIASDLGIVAPDQRIYRKSDLRDDQQPVKPVTYSVIKHGLVGLTKYLATYWAHKNIRVNSLCPGGVFNHQPEEFVTKLTNLIPMGRMAFKDEYKAAVVFLVSDASSYMTGTNLIIDGGRTCW